MASAKKLKSGNWRCLVFIGKDKNGKRQYKSFTASTKKEAELLALSYAEDEKGDCSESEVRVGYLVDQYIELKSNILSVSTIREYKKIRKTCFPELFQYKACDVTSAILQSFVNKEAGKTSSKTVKNRFSLILSALKDHNPDVAYRIRYPQRVKPDIQIPSSEDVARIIEYARGTEMELPILLGACVGMRRSEICALDKHSQGRLIVSKVVLQDSNGAWVTQNRAKTEAGNRLVYAPPFVMEVVKRNGLPIKLNPNQIGHRFRAITRALDMPDYRFHDLRHYYASELMAAGIPDKYVMERIGHATDHMLKTVYQHTMKEKNKKIDSAIDNVFEKMQHEMQHESENP